MAGPLSLYTATTHWKQSPSRVTIGGWQEEDKRKHPLEVKMVVWHAISNTRQVPWSGHRSADQQLCDQLFSPHAQEPNSFQYNLLYNCSWHVKVQILQYNQTTRTDNKQ